MSDDNSRDAASAGRKTMSSTVHVGSNTRSVPGEMNFLSGEVDIEIGGVISVDDFRLGNSSELPEC